ncbi:MAG: copper homeostasis membrane protein CopD [Proteobacteria bacterium]|nr:copper homeostasis membrane protein CopD [Pseudomonadota bacterium]
MNDPLIFWRAIHFLATLQAAGIVLFRILILRDQGTLQQRRTLDRIFWTSLAITFASGLGWFLAIAASIGDASLPVAISDGTAAMLLTTTQFGIAWLARSLTGVGLAICELATESTNAFVKLLRAALAVALVGGLAFAGHAGSEPGLRGDIHLAADILHLTAASLWLGGLLPYAVCLATLRKDTSSHSIRSICDITENFSNGAMAAVLLIVATGIINAVNLVGSVELLFSSSYGRLLLLKLAVFFAMMVIAATNRFVLTPLLSGRKAIAVIQRNAFIEAALGVVVIAIVAILGTMAPA